MAKGERRLSIESIDRGVYGVRSLDVSGSDTGNLYQVDANRLSCDCRAGQVRRACRHVAFVNALLASHEPIITTPLLPEPSVATSPEVAMVDLPDEGF